MPVKARHGRRKYRTASTEKGTVPQPSVTNTRLASNEKDRILPSPGSKVEPGTAIKTSTKVPEKEKYAHVSRELKEIGILTALILAILFVSAVILR